MLTLSRLESAIAWLAERGATVDFTDDEICLTWMPPQWVGRPLGVSHDLGDKPAESLVTAVDVAKGFEGRKLLS